MKRVKYPFENAVVAKTHTSLYLMHKYWARKAYNVIDEYIKYYTNEGDVVFDPFMGSGVTVCEALKLNREAIGNDLNPMAHFITEVTIEPVNLERLRKSYENIHKEIKNKISKLYRAKCSKCGKYGEISHVIWQKDKYSEEKMLLVRLNCINCGKQERRPNSEDANNYKKIKEEGIPYFYPKDIPLHVTAKRSVEYIHELFTHRALIVLSILLHEIEKENEPKIKKALKFIFTSSLAQASKLVFIISKRAGKATKKYEVGAWTVPNYWIPDQHFEINVWNCFSERYKKFNKGKTAESEFNKKDKTAILFNKSATNLKEIKDRSVDYVFTDPPYGSSIPYLGLSLMWSAWLGWNQKLKFDSEILISERGKEENEIEKYRKLLTKSFKETYRILKPGCWMTVTFHNREILVWNSLIAATLEAGFVYENDNYVVPSRVSAKSLAVKAGSMTGDIYINFKKPERSIRKKSRELEEAKRLINEEAEKVILARGGQATTDQLSRGVWSVLSRNNLLSEIGGKEIHDILSSHFVEKAKNLWILPEDKKVGSWSYIPLNKRIEYIIDNVLESRKGGGFDLDDFLVVVFTQLKNGLTPEAKEIIEVLKKKADIKRNKWYPKEKKQLELFEKAIPISERESILNEEQSEHNRFIYQLATLGLRLNYNIWIGKNEQNQDKELRGLSSPELKIAGLSSDFIEKNRIDQIDLLWLDFDKSKYMAFEIENSTRMMTCLQRLANFTEKLRHIHIPIYIVAPDRLESKILKEFATASAQKLISGRKYYVLYSRLMHYLDLLDKGHIEPSKFLKSVSEEIE